MQSDLKRTHSCGLIRISDTGEDVVLNGWINSIRDLGGVVFATLRDRSGIVQIVFRNEDAQKTVENIRPEFVVSIKGTVKPRPGDAKNPDMPTGDIEILVTKVSVLNPSEVLPFEISIPDEEMPGEDIRLRYRYLDLRRPSIQKNIITRHRVNQICRKYLDEKDFLEIETPFLTKSTPEGARDFLVPCRLVKGTFYALPQSPQLFKQLLMVAGFEKYFQIVKCFRDEDLRADRQPEFTQLDIEMSFIEQEDIKKLIDGLFKILFKEILDIDIELPIKSLTYEEAMSRWGSDRPDLRFGVELSDIGSIVSDNKIPFLREAAENNAVYALAAKENGKFSRKEIEALGDNCKAMGATGILWFRMKEGKLTGPGAKAFANGKAEAITKTLALEDGDLAFVICAKKKNKAQQAAGELRIKLGKELSLIPEGKFALTWVTDFPLFELDEESGLWTSVHHPFTAPCEEDIQYLEKDPERVKSQAYDIVVNGAELGGGSIRIHTKKMQETVFRAINLSEEEAQSKFSFLLKALQFGAPPHGGIALGLDRLVAILVGANSIREVIPFPKTHRGNCLMTGSPSGLNEDQLSELGLKIDKKVNS